MIESFDKNGSNDGVAVFYIAKFKTIVSRERLDAGKSTVCPTPLRSRES